MMHRIEALDLKLKDPPEQTIAEIPRETVTLDLRGNIDLENKEVQKPLLSFFQQLPRSISGLNFSLCNLNAQEDDNLAAIINTLDHITALFLKGNEFGCKSGAKLIKIAQALPPSVKIFNIGGNKLGNLELEELVEFFKAIPTTVTKLSLHWNKLNKQKGNLYKALSAIPESVNTVDLSGNYLHLLTQDHLSQALSSLSNGVKKLIFRENNLASWSVEALENVLSKIPEGVTHLDLSGNNWGIKSAADRARIFAAIPTTVQQLCYNEHGYRKRVEVVGGWALIARRAQKAANTAPPANPFIGIRSTPV